VSAESSRIADALRTATFDAFDEIVQLCMDREANFLIVSGDVFDSEIRDLHAQLFFHERLTKLARKGIQSFVAHGNHDPLDGWSTCLNWPAEVTIFPETLRSIRFFLEGSHRATIHGISYPTKEEKRNLAKHFPNERENDSAFQIGVLHCNVGSNTGHEAYAQCELKNLEDAAIDYWALGHVHAAEVLCRRPYVVYAGNPQGRSIRETGKRGCYLVEIGESNEVSLTFHPTDKIRWFLESLDISNIDTMDLLVGHIRKLVEGFQKESLDRPLIIRIALAGHGDLYSHLIRDNGVTDCLKHCREIFSKLSPFVWLEQIDLKCGPSVDLDLLAAREDFVGCVVRAAKDLSNCDKKISSDLFRPLFRNSAGIAIRSLSQEDWATLVEEAALMCHEALDEP